MVICQKNDAIVLMTDGHMTILIMSIYLSLSLLLSRIYNIEIEELAVAGSNVN